MAPWAPAGEQPETRREAIRIGLLHSLSGTMMLSEKPLLDAAQLAIDEINQAGGVLGRRVQPVLADGGSVPEQFAEAARDLLRAGVSALFGCWTSASRKAVRPLVEAGDHLLWYPVQYEGLEESPCICYTGSCLNQQIIPAVAWTLERFGRRLFLLGSDYVFPRAANQLIRSMAASHGSTIVSERYCGLGAQDFGAIVAEILRLRPSAVINTLNGDSNLAFYRQCRAAGLGPAEIPIVATSVTEIELAHVAAEAEGHYACWGYFQSLDTLENREFVARFRSRHGADRLVSAPMVSAYSQVYLWKQAVERAGVVEPSEVRRRVVGCALRSPLGEIRIEANHHLSMPVRIGRLQGDGQFEIVWSKDEPLAPLPWLGIEQMEFPGREMVRQSLAAFADNLDRASQLEREIAERRALEAALERTNAELEARVAERTRQLEQSVASLEREIAGHRETAELLRHSRADALTVMMEAVEARREAEVAGARLRSVLESPKGVIVYSLDPTYRYTMFTHSHRETMKDVWGVEIELGQSVLELIPRPEDRAVARRNFDRALAGEHFAVTEEFEDDTRRRTAWENRYSPICGSDGTILGVTVFVIDITERRQAEAALREREQRYRDLFELESDAILLVDNATGCILEANGSAVALYGYSREELLARRNTDLSAEPEETSYVSRQTEVAAKTVITIPLRLHRRKDGTVFPVEITGRFFQMEGRPVHLAAIRDVTERRRAEADRLRLGKLESTGIMAGGIAHDFNNLLTVVTLGIEMARVGRGSPAETNACLVAAQEATAAAQQLTRHLITFAQGGDPIRQRTRLEPLLHQSVRIALSGSTVEERWEVAPDLWEAEVDAGQISQVVRSLVLNAREAQPGGGMLTIAADNVTLDSGSGPGLPPGDYLRLRFSDRGSGIAPEVLPKIFDPYFSTKQRGAQKGTGLGLAICHSVVKQHGGAISVQTEVDQGTTFTLHLPALRAASSEPGALRSAPAGATAAANRILVMDDEDLVRTMVGHTLERLGHGVVLAKEGQEAVALYRQAREEGRPFDLVFLDLTVRGGLGGLETVRLLRAIDPGVRAVVMSGYAGNSALRDSAQHGFCDVLTKPFDRAGLTRVLARVMAR